ATALQLAARPAGEPVHAGHGPADGRTRDASAQARDREAVARRPARDAEGPRCDGHGARNGDVREFAGINDDDGPLAIGEGPLGRGLDAVDDLDGAHTTRPQPRRGADPAARAAPEEDVTLGASARGTRARAFRRKPAGLPWRPRSGR